MAACDGCRVRGYEERGRYRKMREEEGSTRVVIASGSFSYNGT
jgi:hypothetical protein